jgi:hypothetical protein
MSISQIHPFERAGFGHAPYRCTGHTRAVYRAAPDAPAQPGTSCDYCGIGIMDVYFVASANGVAFKVGSDCIRKVLRGFDKTIPPDFRAAFLEVEREKREVKRQAAHARIVAAVERARETLDAVPALFANQPHPYEYHAKQGKTLRDYYEWILAHGGDHGKQDVCRKVKEELLNRVGVEA